MDDETSSGSDRPSPRKRTKTGCITCRIRRVKCDETKPSCNKCLQSKRVCDGYLPASHRHSSGSKGGARADASNTQVVGNPGALSRRALAVALRQLHAVGPTARILAPSPYLQDDVACFDFFRFRATSFSHDAREPSQDFPSFWNSTLLQAAHLEPAIWHTVAALGALYRKWEVTSSGWALPMPTMSEDSSPESGIRVKEVEDGLESVHDTKSVAVRDADLQSLRLADQASSCYTKALSLAKSIDDPAYLLILSIGLAATSNISGKWIESSVHIKAGQQIMAQIADRDLQSEVKANAAESLAKLAFQWIAFSGKTTSDPFPENRQVDDAQGPLVEPLELPQESGGPVLHRANMMLVRMARRILSEASVVDMQKTQVDVRVTSSHDSTACTEVEKSVVRDMERWECETLHLLSTHHPSALGTTLELLSIKLLQTTIRLLIRASVMSTSYSELNWDGCLAHFERIVALVALIFKKEAEINPLRPPVVSLDEPAISMCLWLVAHRCRHPVVRRRALELLSGAQRLEGKWTSTSTSVGAAKVIEIEEGSASMAGAVARAFGSSWADVEAGLVRSIEDEDQEPESWLGRDAEWLSPKTGWALPGEKVVPLRRRIAQTDVSVDFDPRAGRSKADLELTFADRDWEGKLRKQTVSVCF